MDEGPRTRALMVAIFEHFRAHQAWPFSITMHPYFYMACRNEATAPLHWDVNNNFEGIVTVRDPSVHAFQLEQQP